jgi:hypothetical protein
MMMSFGAIAGTELHDTVHFVVAARPSLKTVHVSHTPVRDVYTLKYCPFLLYSGMGHEVYTY